MLFLCNPDDNVGVCFSFMRTTGTQTARQDCWARFGLAQHNFGTENQKILDHSVGLEMPK